MLERDLTTAKIKVHTHQAALAAANRQLEEIKEMAAAEKAALIAERDKAVQALAEAGKGGRRHYKVVEADEFSSASSSTCTSEAVSPVEERRSGLRFKVARDNTHPQPLQPRTGKHFKVSRENIFLSHGDGVKDGTQAEVVVGQAMPLYDSENSPTPDR